MLDNYDKFSVVFSILEFYLHTTLFVTRTTQECFIAIDCFNVFGAVIKRPLRLVFDLQHIIILHVLVCFVLPMQVMR